MKKTFAMLLSILLMTAGCASYQPSSMPLPKTEQIALTSMTDCGVQISVDPFVQATRQKEVFGGDLGEAGIIPIQIVFVNKGERRIHVTSSDIVMVLPDATRINQTGARAACSKMSGSGSVVASWILFGAVGAMVAHNAEEKARTARLEDYLRKEFQEATLEPGSTAHGFLFFLPPVGHGDFDAAVLQIRLTDLDDKSVTSAEFLPKALRFKGAGTIKDNDVQSTTK